MSDPGAGGFPPPPGWTPPPPQKPAWAADQVPGPVPAQAGPAGSPPPPVWTPPPGMLGAAHKPGAMPLRPLGLGDIYDAAFRIIRFNPKATVGSAVLVASVAMAIPVLITALLDLTTGIALDGGADMSTQDAVGVIGAIGSLAVGFILLSIGTLLVTGMIAHVTAAAAIGRRLSLGEAWAATHGKRWRLVGLTLVLSLLIALVVGVYVLLWVLIVLAGETLVTVLWGVITVPAFLCLMVWFWIRIYYLPVPTLMLEPLGIFGAIGRGYALTRRQFWRTFGIAILTLLVTSVAAQVLGVPIGIVGQVASIAIGPEHALLVLVVTNALSMVISAAFVTPFTAAVTSLQYLDQRMRKEAYDVELMQQAGITS